MDSKPPPKQIGTVRMDDENLTIWKSFYNDNGRLAVFVMDEMGAPYMKLSVNLGPDDMVEGSSDVAEDEFFVRLGNYDEHLHVPLLATGLFQDTQKRVKYGRAVPGAVWRLCS
jgi:hypothetical protein